MLKASIVIPSLGRGDSLKNCLASLDKQTYKNFERIVVKDEDQLTRVRNKGLSQAKGDVVIFTDDDVYFPPTWLENIISVFTKFPMVGGVSGPAIIEKKYKGNRDITRFKTLKKIYDFMFLEGKENLPGLITKAGTWTTGAMNDSLYEGEVDYLEACNMAYRKECLDEVKGFDETFRGVGDWSEPDLAFRVREKGWKLWFSGGCRLYHRPNTGGAFRKRHKDYFRLENYKRFASKHIRPSKKHSMYLLFLKIYYKMKGTI